MQWIFTNEVQIFVRFTLRLAISEIQGRQKSEMHRVTPNETCTFNSQKYPIYTKYFPLRSKFWPVSLFDQRFPRYRTFYNSPLTTMLNSPKKNKTICQKSRVWNFTILYTTLVETVPRSMPEFFRSKCVVLFQTRCRLKFYFSHMVPC